jgi:AcrR family transcriptional regulator
MDPIDTRRRRKDARPQEILDAALTLFVEKGYSATRTDEVAQLAGASKGTLYLYYPSKEELLKAVIAHHLSARIADGAAMAGRYVGSSADLLREVLVPWWQHMVNSPASAVFKLVITEVRNFPEIAAFYQSEVIEPGERLIGTIIERGIACGDFRPVPIASTVHSLVMPMVMMCLHKHSLGACAGIAPEVDPDTFIAEHLELLLHGLVAQSASTHGALFTSSPLVPEPAGPAATALPATTLSALPPTTASAASARKPASPRKNSRA